MRAVSADEETWGGVDLDAVLQQSHEAFIVMDDAGIVRAWNPAAERTFGWPRDEAIGARLSELIIPRRYRELHERGLQTYLETGVGPVLGTTIEIEGIDRFANVVPVELTITPTERADGSRVFHAFIKDVTHRRRLERLLRASERVAWLCADHPGAVPAGALLEAFGIEMGFSLGIAWLPHRGASRLDLAASWAPSDAAAAFVAESAAASFERGSGIPGRTWETGEPRWSGDVSDDTRFIRKATAEALGFRAGLFVPVGTGSACRGVLEFLSDERRAASTDLLVELASLGERIAAHLEPGATR